MPVISVIVGSIRQGRFCDKPARWIFEHLKQREGIDPRLLDLRDFSMPFFDAATSPAWPNHPPFENETVQRWTAAIAASDAFIFVTPEYNYGTSAVLKNALDWVYPEWNRKPCACVSYGGAGGARAIQQLRESAIELQMAPIRASVHLPITTLQTHFKGADVEKALAESDPYAKTVIDDLLWWTEALRAARSKPAQ